MLSLIMRGVIILFIISPVYILRKLEYGNPVSFHKKRGHYGPKVYLRRYALIE
jgi:hypothetical protein